MASNEMGHVRGLCMRMCGAGGRQYRHIAACKNKPSFVRRTQPLIFFRS